MIDLFEQFLSEVKTQFEANLAKYGEQDKPKLFIAATEELGELAQALLVPIRKGKHSQKTESIHICAVLLAIWLRERELELLMKED